MSYHSTKQKSLKQILATKCLFSIRVDIRIVYGITIQYRNYIAIRTTQYKKCKKLQEKGKPTTNVAGQEPILEVLESTITNRDSDIFLGNYYIASSIDQF